MFSNGNSFAANGGSACMAAEDPVVQTLPWLFRVTVPGFEAGWPAR